MVDLFKNEVCRQQFEICIGCALGVRVDRNQIVGAFDLQPMTGVINERNGIFSNLLAECANGGEHCISGQIELRFASYQFEAQATEGCRH
jgi:hypothetical protein